MRGHGKISKVNHQAASGSDRCLCPDLGGVHGNARSEIVALTYRALARPLWNPTASDPWSASLERSTAAEPLCTAAAAFTVARQRRSVAALLGDRVRRMAMYPFAQQ